MKSSTHLILVSAVLLLAACARTEPAAATPETAAATEPTPAQMAAGKVVFEKVCAVCHQPTGLGVPGTFPPLAGSPILTETDPGKIIRATLYGLQGPIEVNGKTYNSIMTPQVAVLKDEELAAAITYARNSWGNKAPAVSAEAVNIIRLTGKRDTFWTWEELNRK